MGTQKEMSVKVLLIQKQNYTAHRNRYITDENTINYKTNENTRAKQVKMQTLHKKKTTKCRPKSHGMWQLYSLEGDGVP